MSDSELRRVFTNQLNIQENSDVLFDILLEFKKLMTVYKCAIKEITTKFEVLNEELSVESERNPIQFIHSRVKEPMSILDKLQRKGVEFSLDAVSENLNDVAGIRIICKFVDDIYRIADMLIKQDDIKLIGIKDYIKNPKPNGYRSYHMIVEIPVFFSNKKQLVKAEIQLRTIAMDFWASLEHELKYKKSIEDTEMISKELVECATDIFEMDSRMQQIKYKIDSK